jgi:thiol-disulfide isomerase/thioredoxin
MAVASCGGGGTHSGSGLRSGQYLTLDGATASIDDFKGAPLVVNFFASWCTPCRLEMPDFERVHRTLGDKVQFVGLNVQEDVDRANNVVNDTKVTYTIGLDKDGIIYRGYNGVTMPMTVFLDAQGKVVKMHGGALDAADLTNIIHNEFGVT